MSDERSAPTVRPYRPFPSFAEWSMVTTVSPVVDVFRSRFAEIRSASHDGGAALRERATRWAAIDTGAIEGLYQVDRGFTISVAAATALLEVIQAQKGESVEQAVADALDAYEFVLDLATRSAPLTEVAVRELHAIVCRGQESYRVLTAVGPQDRQLPKGVYKTSENHPLNVASNTLHSYAPVIDTPAEMARFVEELRTPGFEDAHPVQQAAYAHYAFVAIHPFSDGNGRVSRAIASSFLYRDPGIPLVVFDDEKPEYFSALEAADDGYFQPFVAFVGDRVVDTVNLLQTAQGPERPPLADRAAAFATELSGRGGRPHDEVDAGAKRLLERFAQHLDEAVIAGGLVEPLSAQVHRAQGFGHQAPEGFRVPEPLESVVLTTTSSRPASARRQSVVGTAVARGLDGDVDYLVYSNEGLRLEVFIREVLPRVTRTLDLRIRAAAEVLLNEQVDAAMQEGRHSLRSNGFA